MVLHSIDMGPDLPHVSNITLVHLGSDGSIVSDVIIIIHL